MNGYLENTVYIYVPVYIYIYVPVYIYIDIFVYINVYICLYTLTGKMSVALVWPWSGADVLDQCRISAGSGPMTSLSCRDSCSLG